MSFFWPTERNPDPGFLARIGQLLHYAGVAWGVLLIYAMAQAGGSFSPNSLGAGLLFGVPFILGGRALRWMLAGE